MSFNVYKLYYFPVVDDFLDVSGAADDVAAFQDIFGVVFGKLVALNVGTVVSGTDDGVFLKLLFPQRQKRRVFDDFFGGFYFGNTHHDLVGDGKYRTKHR